MTLKLATLHSKNQIQLILAICNVLNIKLLLRSIVGFYQSQYPTPGKKLSKLSYFILILSKNKENVTFTWSAGVQNVLFLTITGDKFVIYVPIRRYGDFNTFLQPVHPSAVPQDVLSYFGVLKSPYLWIEMQIQCNLYYFNQYVILVHQTRVLLFTCPK